MRDEQRGRVALRRPVHIFVGRTPKRFSADEYFKFDDALPPTPPRFLREIGVNWLRDASVAYGCLVISRRTRAPVKELVREAIRDWSGCTISSRPIKWETMLGGRSFRIVVFVQSDASIRYRSKSAIKLVTLAKNLKLFDADELTTGSYCISTSR